MPSPVRALRLNARELLRRPGLERPVVVTVGPDDLDIDDERIDGAVEVRLLAASTVDSVVVTGEVSVPWTSPCRRCLAQVADTAAIDVDEVYQDDPGPSDDTFAIDGDQIDLVPAVREAVLLGVPDAAVCDESCAGLCPVCGVDRNIGSCACDTTVRDERWAVLDDLRLDD